MFRISIALSLVIMSSSCTWVKLSESGADVRVTNLQDVAACERVGKITSVSKAKVAGVRRSEKKLSTELETIARNEALDLGGNTIVESGQITGDEQTFQVFNCP